MKNIVITGASRGIGRAIAVKLAEKDTHLFIHGRNTKDLAETAALVKETAGRVTQILADFSTTGGCDKLVLEAGDEPFDVLVNNAGMAVIKTVEQLTLDNWNKTIAVNVTAPFIITQKLMRQMKKGSSIVNILSTAARNVFTNWSSYCMSKHALRGFSDTLREELRPRGIRVIAVYPGSVDTAIWNTIPGEWPKEKMLKPEQVAAAVAFALSRPDDTLIEDISLGHTVGRL